MRITQKFGSYNQRRYSRPWISKVIAWPVGGKAEIVWGCFLGDNNGGVVEIEANIGDIVRTGQKDNRGDNGSAGWYIVYEDGLREVTMAEAKIQWGLLVLNYGLELHKIEKNPLENFTMEELLTEIERRKTL